MANGNGKGGSFWSNVVHGAGFAVGASIGLGVIALVANHVGLVPREFVIFGAGRRRGYEAYAGTQNTLAPGPGGKYYLY